MKSHFRLILLILSGTLSGFLAAAEPAVTIYNQDFAVVREIIPLQLEAGTNEVSFNDITAHLEPDTVILRDPRQKVELQILEQNYRADPISQNLLLSMYEGQTIDFEILQGEKVRIIPGKIIRSGYVPHQFGLRRYGAAYAQTQYARSAASGQPVIEVDGKLRFSLPGTPLFPALKDETILKPTLNWVLESGRRGSLDAELAYITGGMGWEAAYNVISPEKSDDLDLSGWVTIDNQSGKTFDNAAIKLMAGDVNRVTEPEVRVARMALARSINEADRAVSEKAFDEFHLYTLNRKTTIRDRETKQVEFIRAEDVNSQRLYIYDGAQIDPRTFRNWTVERIRQDRNYGTESNDKVWVMREFINSRENNLGIPLPRGRIRFYRRDADGKLEFTGENLIDHTPKDETVRVYTGDAFDIRGERRQTRYEVNASQDWLDESFEITLRNHKKEQVEIRVVERLYRWVNWKITAESQSHAKKDSRTVEYRVKLMPDEEKKLTYTAHYTW